MCVELMEEKFAVKKCSACKSRDAFYFRPYSGERLCRKCFTQSLEAKVRATIGKYRMFEFDDRIAVAVSGGKDSLNLLHILAKIEKRNPNSSLVAVTIDEGISGYRDEALKLAASNCLKLGIEHHIVAFKELFGFTLDEIVSRISDQGRSGLTPCAYCGILRRKALNLGAREVCADKVATAHTLDDEVQTILLNIFRGDISGLIKEKPLTDLAHPKFVQKVKPFCEILEKESALYTYVRKIRFQDIPCPYASEALRNEVRVMLNQMEERHAGTKFTVFKSIERIRVVLGEAAVKGDFRECSECGEPSSCELCKACEIIKQMT